ncbi:uncharacterized protein LOC135366667 [Ornithodoros turicata]|uniref:Putative conserved plasma membrane protein n=1 Tax=Ornithodoros turicata TaxID=34597 RepID=A0A2R5LLN2_9ACAR
MRVYSHHPFLALAFCAAAGVLFIYPFVLRYTVYKDSFIAMAITDMLPVRDRVSSTWCSGQELSMNHSFSAYVFRDRDTPAPTRSLERVITLNMTMVIPKQTYEYWGFYFLEGSSFTVSVCSRLSGAAFSLIRGTPPLRACLAALARKREGRDDSDEDSDEDELGSSPESDEQSSTLSSSEGMLINETHGIHVCNNALFHVPLRWTYSCGTPHDRQDHKHNITYHVKSSDFYYMFFASNPPLYVTPNTIDAKFYLNRTLYDTRFSVAKTGEETCKNVSQCTVNFGLGSDEYMVVQMDVNSTTPSWTSDVLTSKCLPRKGLYFVFYFVFGLFIMMAAFQG